MAESQPQCDVRHRGDGRARARVGRPFSKHHRHTPAVRSLSWRRFIRAGCDCRAGRSGNSGGLQRRAPSTKREDPRFIRLFGMVYGAAALSAVSHIAWAQTYPTRPVRIVVGFPPGGGADITARLIGQWLSERLGQPFIIENRPGAGSNIATEAVVRAPADGYTLLLVGAFNAVNATLYDKLNFNFIRDIAPVAGIIVVPNVMVVHLSFPAKTILEFIAYSKSNPG